MGYLLLLAAVCLAVGGGSPVMAPAVATEMGADSQVGTVERTLTPAIVEVATATPTQPASPTATMRPAVVSPTNPATQTQPAPTATAATAAAQAETSGESATIPDVPAVLQAHSLSCEYAATSALTQFWGRPLWESDFIRAIPTNPNPHLGFRGNIDGAGGGTTDYGVYAEPIAAVLERNGYRAEVFYGTTDRLRSEIVAGHPVVVWITVIGSAFQPTRLTDDAGREFSVVPWEHAVVAYGFDQDGIQIMDVAYGTFRTLGWGEFLRRWSLFDQMALVAVPIAVD